MRYTVSPGARQEILDRLLQLNFDRYDEEETKGLHKKASRGGPAKPPPQLKDDTEPDTLF